MIAVVLRCSQGLLCRGALTLLALLLSLGVVACAGAGGGEQPDGHYGHRYKEVGPDGRETVLLRPVEDSTEARVYPAVVQEVIVRPESPVAPPGKTVEVELLLKGALPDACASLSGLSQNRAGNIVTVQLDMRLPRGEVCAQVARPFRFYVLLDGGFEPGAYTVTVNGSTKPFRIREGESRE